MKELKSHKSNVCNDNITLIADEPGHGGASHEYIASFMMKCGECETFQHYAIRFQNGPIKESGGNGITHEVLLAILIDRLEGFQSGPYKCDDNALALDHCRMALQKLHNRTESRATRGVEGTHNV